MEIKKNVLYEKLLELPMPPKAVLVIFVDDLSIVVNIHNKILLEQLLNPILERVNH